MAEKTVVGEVIYKVSLDHSSFDSDVKRVQASANSLAESLENSAKNTEKSAKQASSELDKLKESITGVVAAAASLHTVASGISTVVDAYSQYESAMNGATAVARATGNSVSESMQVIKDATANGLVSEADAAAAVKNLELYGYTAQQAGELIGVLTNSAAYNRQANYSLSEAVRVTTEGIRMENSVLSDAAGVQKNIAKMYEDYAAQIGKSATNLTQAEKAQAVYNGVMEEGGIFAGDAESYTKTLAGSQDQLRQAITKVEQSLGSMFSMFAPIISGIASFINSNRELVVGLAAAAAVIIGGGGIVIAIRTVIPLIASLSASIGGLLGPLGLLIGLGTAVGIVAATSASNFGDYSSSADEASASTSNLAEETQGLGATSSKTQKQLAKLRKQIDDVYENYKKDLKAIKDRHESTIADLTRQIENANADYIRAVDERNAAFNVTEDEEKRKHQEKVDALTQQLNFLQRYNNKYNQEKLAQVQFALQKEQALYEKETANRKAELDVQNAADKSRLAQRLAETQKELDEELAFMNKHRDELNSVRDVILLDEIESLRERRDESLANLQEQIADNATAGADAGAAFKDAYVNQLSQIPSNVSDLGKNAGANFSQGMAVGMWEHLKKGGIIGDMWRVFLGDELYNAWMNGNPYEGYAAGGYTGRGDKDEVAGIVHRGEYVLPQEMVDQTTGTPKVGQTVNITVNASGIMAVTEQEKRRVGMELANAVSQVLKARSLA